MRTIILVSLLISLGTAYAVDWLEIGKDVYIDADNIQATSGDVVYWTKLLNRSDSFKSQGKPVWFLITRNLGNCETKTTAVSLASAYDRKGDPLDSDYRQFPRYEPVIPGTLGETQLEVACQCAKEECHSPARWEALQSGKPCLDGMGTTYIHKPDNVVTCRMNEGVDVDAFMKLFIENQKRQP